MAASATAATSTAMAPRTENGKSSFAFQPVRRRRDATLRYQDEFAQGEIEGRSEYLCSRRRHDRGRRCYRCRRLCIAERSSCVWHIDTACRVPIISQSAKYAIGFLAAGVLYLIVGAIIVSDHEKPSGETDLVPDRTVEELRKDKQWLKNEL